MSFGGGFGGFGQAASNNQSSGFGGFGGSNNNNNNNSGTGFGSGGTGFGASNTNTGGGLFGSTNNNASSNTGGGFGNSSFGGAGSGGGLFGGGNNATQANNSTSTGFGGFGASNNTANNTSSPFGGGAASGGGGLFGGGNANKTTGFGAPANTGGSLFGSTANNTSGGFGSGGFGASNNPGLGQGVGEPPGTAGTAFQAFQEKEANNASQTNSFQNILFQEPYKKWSSDELRLADYVQGRRHGNGQAGGGGAFGVSSGFGGGFGSTPNNNASGGGLFGSSNTNNNQQSGGGLFGGNNASNTNNNTSGFGQGSGGFGSTNTNNNTGGGGLFGSKPAGGGLFGNSNTQPQQTSTGFGGASSGGGFGAANNTSSGFGSGNTGGGLFGSNNNQQQQQKPAGGLFGSTTTNNNTGGFGNTSNNAFGSTSNNAGGGGGGGLFGNNNANQTQQQQSGGGLFGNNNNAQQSSGTGGFGGFGQQNQAQNQTQQSGGLFGNNQQKPAGSLFGGGGASNTGGTGGGLFGNNASNSNNQQQQQTGAFGQNNNQQQGGGLFGGNKPATGGGLFGSSTAQNNNTGGGLFGNAGNNQQQQPQTGGGLFGGSMNNSATNQQKPGLFGGSTTQNTGGGLFGGQNNQNQGSSLFGGSTNQQQQNQGMGNSLLGNSQQANNAPQGLTANLNDVSAYGSPSLFSSTGPTESVNPGPLATPVNGSAKPRRASILPMYKLAPSSASRQSTPQKRGFGFSYSTYGTPGSPASSVGTPGTAGRSLLASSSTGSLGKSMSSNNLRRNFNTEDSILAPGAFSASTSGPRWYGSTGSKKLVISRDMRSDLFSTPQKDNQLPETDSSSRKIPKRVSFDTGNAAADEPQPEIRGALPAPEQSPEAPVDTTPRQSRNGAAANGVQSPETEPTPPSAVPDESQASTPGRSSVQRSSVGPQDAAPGAYWTSPAYEELEKLNRVQRQKIDGLVVGRENVGSVAFLEPADISAFDLEELLGGIVQLEPRSATVYPVAARKPPVGKGLNRRSRITLEGSFPRGHRQVEGRKLEKHIKKLMEMKDTHFESYNSETGTWEFLVDHFTTYGLDDDDDEDTEMEPQPPAALSGPQQHAFNASTASSAQDDTFHFRRSQGLPGAFDEADAMVQGDAPQQESFLGVSSADSAPNDVHLALEEEPVEQMGEEYDMSDDDDMTRSDVGQHLAAEHEDVSSVDELDELDAPKGTPGGVLRARRRALQEFAGPVDVEVADGDDWAEMLRKTVSPAKRDRQMLKELNDASPSRRTGRLIDFDDNDEPDMRKSTAFRKSTANKKDLFGKSTAGLDKSRGFATSIDLMNSLFEKPKPRTAAQSLRASTDTTKGFPKWPYERHDKNLTVAEAEKAFHDGSRPTWGPDETLVVTRPNGNHRRSLRDRADVLAYTKSGIQSSRQMVRFGKFSTESSTKYLRVQEDLAKITLEDGVPRATLSINNIKDVFHHQDMSSPASVHEKRVWDLASILFDGSGGNAETLRKASLSMFWAELVDQVSSKAIGLARTNEEKAVACLAGHRITEACKYLLDGRNYRLATLLPLIGTHDDVKRDMREQIKAWQDSKMLSEFTEPMRAIYELLGGNPCVCEGMKGVPVEDRLESFVISKYFGFDWKQAFGLRLWYAISDHDDLASAVRKFQEDIDQDREGLPQPWYLEQGIQPLWFDYESHHRQDLLWGLLQLYADQGADLEAVLRPENSQLSPVNMRLTWQLGLALTSTGKVSFGMNGDEKADAVTLSYAAQLSGAGEWIEAIFVLLHLSDASARKKVVQDELCRHAASIGSESDTNFSTLTEKLQIPASWVWEALALSMRSKKNRAAEVHCLLKAGAFAEAHAVLIQHVAPRAIIERDYTTLGTLMAQFEGHDSTIADWNQGGEIYNLFLSLVQHRSRGETAPRPTLDRLLAGLQNEQVTDKEIERYAALSDMADETAKEIVKLTRKKQDAEFRSRILKLPLTQDRLLAYSVDLGMDRYREVMTH